MTVSCRRPAGDVEGTSAADRDEPAASTVPQRAQNLLPSGFSALQCGQTMPHLRPLGRVRKSQIDVATMAERGNAVTAVISMRSSGKQRFWNAAILEREEILERSPQ